MLKFEVFQPKESTTTLKNLGTVSSLIGKGGTLNFINKNFADATKRVALLFKRTDNTSAVVTCSAKLSELLRSKKLNVSQLLGCSVVENEQGVAFISVPGAGLTSFNIDEFTPTTFSGNTLEELIG